jgi:acyl-CoA synthetase (AMP-forming)/AMP-acid ligase II
VESALYEHPLAIDAAVVGIPHRTLGEEPGAVVHLMPASMREISQIRAAGGCGDALRCRLFGQDKHRFSGQFSHPADY